MFNKLSLACLLVLFLTSCTPAYQDISDQVTQQTLNFPEAKYTQLWNVDNKFAAFTSEYEYFMEDNSKTLSFEIRQGLDSEPGITCGFIQGSSSTFMLPDGRLAAAISCRSSAQEEYIVAYDWKTEKVSSLLHNHLPDPIIMSCFSWDPKTTRAIAGIDLMYRGVLYWLTPTGAEPLELTLTDGTRSWDLSNGFDDFFFFDKTNLESDGYAKCPAWSPNGEKIAFFASLDAIGHKDYEKSFTKFSLYSYSVTNQNAKTIVSGFYNPSHILWSPDNTMVAFLSYLKPIPFSGQQYLWICRLADKKLFQIASPKFFAPSFYPLAWSPDSKSISTIWCLDKDCEKSEIRKFSFKLP